MKKLISAIVILLFIGLAFAPSINANVGKEELVEFTTEVCGLNGGKQTVKLTQQQADEVKELFDSINMRLNATKSKGEAEEIFKDAVVQLDKYGLLGGLSVKQAQKLVIGGYQNPRVIDFIDKLKQSSIGSLVQITEHHSCLVGGYVIFGRVIFTLFSVPFIVLGGFLFWIGSAGLEIISIIGLLLASIGLLSPFIRNPIPGPQLPCAFMLGFPNDLTEIVPAGGKTFVKTSEDVYTYKGQWYRGELMGFTGLRFRSIPYHYFIGYTHWACFYEYN